MMETKKSIQVSFVILLIMMIIGLIYGLTGFIKPELLVARSFQLYTGQSYSTYLAESPKLANYILILERMAAGLGLVVVLGALFVLLISFKKGLKWAWFYVLVCGVLAWGNNLFANAMLNNPLLIIVNIIGIVLIVIGLIIPAKDFFGKS
jgi:hypothetical protein